MKLQYTGMFDAVIVPEHIDPRSGFPVEIRRGEPVDLPDDLAERLLEQRANWRQAAGGKLRDYADIAADVAALEAREAAGDEDAEESPTPTDSETSGNTDEG